MHYKNYELGFPMDSPSLQGEFTIRMLSRLMAVVGAIAVLGAGLELSASAQVDVKIYKTLGSSAGGGTPYSDFAGSFDSPDIKFATDFAYAWHPFGLSTYGALMTGLLSVAADGTYTFGLDSDDGSMFYVDGGLVIDNGGPHGPLLVSGSTFLTAGTHPFKVEFYEDFGGPGGVDLHLPGGVAFTAVPEPGSIAMLAGAGLAGLGILIRRRRK